MFIEQLLALAECRLVKCSFSTRQKYCILSLLSLGRFSEGILINICSKKNAFVWVFTLTILWLSAILKLDFLKSPRKSGSARPPKLGNYTVLIDVIGQLNCDVIGHLSVKPRCYWLWRLVISLVRFDPSIVQLNSQVLLVKWSVVQSFSCLQHSRF